MIQKFTKKETEVQAIQFNGNSNKKQIEEFVGKELKSELESETAYVAGVAPPIFSLLLETDEGGIIKVFRGDWVVKESDGDFYCLKNDNFRNIYGLALSQDDVIKFFDDNLAMFRQWVNEVKTRHEKDIHLRFCDATSFLKCMWACEYKSEIPEVKELETSDNKGIVCPKCGANMVFDVELAHRLPVMYHYKCGTCKNSKNLYEKI